GVLRPQIVVRPCGGELSRRQSWKHWSDKGISGPGPEFSGPATIWRCAGRDARQHSERGGISKALFPLVRWFPRDEIHSSRARSFLWAWQRGRTGGPVAGGDRSRAGFGPETIHPGVAGGLPGTGPGGVFKRAMIPHRALARLTIPG